MRMALTVLALLFATSAVAQAPQSLEGQASDPTASLMAFQLQDFYSPTLHNSDDSLNIVQFRAAIPFTLADVNNIARLTLSYVTESPSGKSGLGDATVFNLATFDRSWGRFGVGAVALIPSGVSGVSAEKWGLGPALGFTAQPRWGLFGLFNQNIVTVAGDGDLPDVNISTLQPILNYPLGNGWSVGSSDMTVVWDWDKDEFVSLPLGAKLSKLTKLGGRPVQFQASYEHNFYDDGVGPEDTIGFTVKLLVPKGA
ncbi:MAG: hypothetical protein CVV17_00050 [Gammaproteobacteria bacterium HGW-Gammaproteobacteria-7]|nr:MAG: hypothetical protein CVV17_00050 [Gammaproteobacteria bacterium HGW-Gammaproteobacteria-7]